MDKALPYVCERQQEDIGCVTGSGAGYQGVASRTRDGGQCKPWDQEWPDLQGEGNKCRCLSNLPAATCIRIVRMCQN